MSPSSRIVFHGLLAFAALQLGAASAETTPTAAQRRTAQDLKALCGADYARLCKGVTPGGGRILACLESHAADLSQPCREALATARDLRANVADPKAK